MEHIITVCGLFIFGPILSIIFCYFRIVLFLRKRSAVGETSVNPNSQNINSSSKTLNTVKILVLTTSVFVITWTPTIVFVFINAFLYILDFEGNDYLTTCLVEFTSYLLNPFLYAWQYDSVRNSIKKLLWKQETSQMSQSVTR